MMDSFMAFLQMGGYGVYVWAAFGVADVVLAANVVYAVWQKRRALQQSRRE